MQKRRSDGMRAVRDLVATRAVGNVGDHAKQPCPHRQVRDALDWGGTALGLEDLAKTISSLSSADKDSSGQRLIAEVGEARDCSWARSLLVYRGMEPGFHIHVERPNLARRHRWHARRAMRGLHYITVPRAQYALAMSEFLTFCAGLLIAATIVVLLGGPAIVSTTLLAGLGLSSFFGAVNGVQAFQARAARHTAALRGPRGGALEPLWAALTRRADVVKRDSLMHARLFELAQSTGGNDEATPAVVDAMVALIHAAGRGEADPDRLPTVDEFRSRRAARKEAAALRTLSEVARYLDEHQRLDSRHPILGSFRAEHTLDQIRRAVEAHHEADAAATREALDP